jgi:hypothetical protein
MFSTTNKLKISLLNKLLSPFTKVNFIVTNYLCLISLICGYGFPKLVKNNSFVFVNIKGANNNVFLTISQNFNGKRKVIYNSSLYSNSFIKNKKLFTHFIERFGSYILSHLSSVKYSGVNFIYCFDGVSADQINFFVPGGNKSLIILANKVSFNGVKYKKRYKLFNSFV